MESTIDWKRGRKGVQNGAKLPIFYNNVYKQLITVQNMVISGKYDSRRQIERYILPFYKIGMDLLIQKVFFCVPKSGQNAYFLQ